MRYVATKTEEANFHYLHRELWRVLEEYEKLNNVKFDGSVLVSPYGDFIVQRKLGFIKRVIITISPPYTTESVNVRNYKFRRLGKQLKDEITKFWTFGKRYDYHKDHIERNFKSEIFATLISYRLRDLDEDSSLLYDGSEEDIKVSEEPQILTDEERKHFEKGLELSIREVEEKSLKEFIESKN
jgi:hypothetical protein